ncbi:MAG: hypothetical protein Q9177_002391, partial [Variospora cf. flavescens]
SYRGAPRAGVEEEIQLRFAQCYNTSDFSGIKDAKECQETNIALVVALGLVKATLFLGPVPVNLSSTEILRLVMTAGAMEVPVGSCKVKHSWCKRCADKITPAQIH